MSGEVTVGGKSRHVKVRGRAAQVDDRVVLLPEDLELLPMEVEVIGVRLLISDLRMVDDQVIAIIDGRRVTALVAPPRHVRGSGKAGTSGDVRSVLPGTIADVRVVAGTQVEAGQVLVILEAMKMLNEVTAPLAGIVRNVPVRKGQTVEEGALLVELDSPSDS